MHTALHVAQKVKTDDEHLSVFQGTPPIFVLQKNLQVIEKVEKLMKFTTKASVS